jgi:hypothetical protein
MPDERLFQIRLRGFCQGRGFSHSSDRGDAP